MQKQHSWFLHPFCKSQGKYTSLLVSHSVLWIFFWMSLCSTQPNIFTDTEPANRDILPLVSFFSEYQIQADIICCMIEIFSNSSYVIQTWNPVSKVIHASTACIYCCKRLLKFYLILFASTFATRLFQALTMQVKLQVLSKESLHFNVWLLLSILRIF